METIYNVDFFINKFEAIPENKWCIEQRFDHAGRRCAHGHCSTLQAEDAGRATKEESALIEIAKSNICDYGFANINNGYDKRYPQPTPKQRILAALYDIKGNSAVNEAVAIVSQSSPETILA